MHEMLLLAATVGAALACSEAVGKVFLQSTVSTWLQPKMMHVASPVFKTSVRFDGW